MRKGLSLLAVLLTASALADGGPGLSPLGVPSSDTVTLHCQSGRDILFFSPNTQSVRLLYRGKVSVLMNIPQPGGPLRFVRYSDVGVPGLSMFEMREQGRGLELRSFLRVQESARQMELYRIVQHPHGQRELTRLERCSG